MRYPAFCHGRQDASRLRRYAPAHHRPTVFTLVFPGLHLVSSSSASLHRLCKRAAPRHAPAGSTVAVMRTFHFTYKRTDPLAISPFAQLMLCRHDSVSSPPQRFAQAPLSKHKVLTATHLSIRHAHLHALASRSLCSFSIYYRHGPLPKLGEAPNIGDV